MLFWGILGAMVLRGIFILVGAALLQTFHWVIYQFGAFLIVTGAKLLVRRASEVHPERNPVFRLFRRLVPSVGDYQSSRFTVVQAGRRFATPLLLVLVAVEITDTAFAVDSIPAIFAITNDPFIVYTSNIFATLGLRALYFVLAGVLGRFCYLNTGLALVLAFVGGKMMLTDVCKVPIGASLAVVAVLLLARLWLPLCILKLSGDRTPIATRGPKRGGGQDHRMNAVPSRDHCRRCALEGAQRRRS